MSTDSTYQTILFDEARLPVLRLVLNRPEKRNPIGPAVCGELVHALGRAAEDARVGCVVITGAGKVFSAGGDLGGPRPALRDGGRSAAEPPSTGPRPALPDGGRSVAEPPSTLGGVAGGVPPASLVELFKTMHGLGKPIVAMLNGHALAGGLGLAVACDLVIASEDAELGTPEVNLGLWPMMITAEIVRSIGRKKALELMLSGERISAREAERIGLINRVVAADRLEDETLALAARLAKKSPAVVRLGLRAFYDTQDMDLVPALEHLQAQLGAVLATEDAAEGIAAFFAKRDPVWKGR